MPRTVVHVVLGLNVGGLERVVVNLARGCRGSRYRAVVCCLEEAGDLAGEVAAAGGLVLTLAKRPGIDVGAAVRLSRLLRRERASVVHTHNVTPHLTGLVAARLAGVPVVVHTKHGRNYPGDRRKVLLNRLLARGTDAVVAVSEDTRRVVLDIERTNPRRVRCILNGVDTELYRPAGDPATRPPVIGTVARLSPEKDQQSMLAAFRLVLNEVADARLVIAGSGPCEAELRATAASLGITASVDFLGVSHDVPGVLGTFSVFTLSSTTEGLSMTLIEALAAGVPAVATDVGGNREIINPPVCGLIVPPSDPAALAAAWIELLRDPERRAGMGAAGRARVVERFSVERMVTEYQDLYDELLDRKGAGTPLTRGPRASG